jgi:hypothetical protein
MARAAVRRFGQAGTAGCSLARHFARRTAVHTANTEEFVNFVRTIATPSDDSEAGARGGTPLRDGKPLAFQAQSAFTNCAKRMRIHRFEKPKGGPLEHRIRQIRPL